MSDEQGENVQMVRKHTPGPWAWNYNHGLMRMDGEGRGCEIVLCATYEYDTGLDISVSEANGRLIAAAPDLLDVAQAAPIPSQYHGVRGFDADGFLDAYAVWNGKRRVVIARATGAAP